jgi:hypothetical protein
LALCLKEYFRDDMCNETLVSVNYLSFLRKFRLNILFQTSARTFFVYVGYFYTPKEQKTRQKTHQKTRQKDSSHWLKTRVFSLSRKNRQKNRVFESRVFDSSQHYHVATGFFHCVRNVLSTAGVPHVLPAGVVPGLKQQQRRRSYFTRHAKSSLQRCLSCRNRMGKQTIIKKPRTQP